MMKRFLFIIFFISAFVYGQKEFGKVTLPLGRVQVQKGGSGNFKKGVLSFYDKYGEKAHEFMNVSYEPRELSPTDDGGFVVKSIREIASIPQPLYVSSLWLDHDVVIEKYDKYKLLTWRKIFNDYDDLRIDFVEVFDN